MDSPLPAFAVIGEACRLTGLSRSRVYDLLAAGHIRSAKIGTRTLIDVRSVVAYLRTLSGAQVRPRRTGVHPRAVGVASGC